MVISSNTFQAIVESLRSEDRTGDSRDRRTASRVGMRGRAMIMPCASGALATRSREADVAVRDLSNGGIGILHTAVMRPGEQFLLLLDDGGGAAGRTVLCSVVRCEPVSRQFYAIGAAFVREPMAIAG